MPVLKYKSITLNFGIIILSHNFGKNIHSAPPQPMMAGYWLRDPQNIPDKWSYYLLLASYYYVAVNNSYWLSRYLCIANVTKNWVSSVSDVSFRVRNQNFCKHRLQHELFIHRWSS